MTGNTLHSHANRTTFQTLQFKMQIETIKYMSIAKHTPAQENIKIFTDYRASSFLQIVSARNALQEMKCVRALQLYHCITTGLP